MEFRILGPLEVSNAREGFTLDAPKVRALLGVLLLHPNEVVSSERLIDELWGERPPATAAKIVQTYVSQLRRTLDPDAIETRTPGYALHVADDALDSARFRHLIAQGRRVAASGAHDQAQRIYQEALALWRGPPLADVQFESFARNEVEQLEEERLSARMDMIDCELALGAHERLVAELETLVSQYPLRERLRAQLMLALYRCGRQADALEVYREGRRALHDELGIEPGPALRGLEQSILRQESELGGAPAAPTEITRRPRRRWPLVVAGLALVGAAVVSAIVATHGSSGNLEPAAVRPQSVAVINPARNMPETDIPTGDYPGPLAADATQVYVANIGAATISTLLPKQRKVDDTFALSRAIDMVAGDRQLWVANGGSPGHTPRGLGNGTVAVLNPGPTVKTFRVGPNINGGPEQTTIAADDSGYSVWAGNKDSHTVRQIDRSTDRTLLTIHGIAPGGLAVTGNSSTGDTVWASDPARNIVARIDEHARRIVHEIPIPKEPTRLAADNNAVWVLTRDRNGPDHWRATRGTTPAVWRIDARTDTPTARIPLPLTPIRIALGDGSVWITAERVLSASGKTVDATVFRIDPKTDRIVARIPLRTGAVDGIIVSHRLVWVAIPASQ